MWEYSEKVMEHFLHPHNVGEVEDPDGKAMVGNIACGDALKLTFKLDENGRIKEARFKTFGCASAIAAAFPCAQSHGRPLHHGSRLYPFQPEYL